MSEQPFIDRPGPVRSGEALPIAQLEAYLREQLGASGPFAVEQFPGGFSNLTYLVHFGEHEFVLRRPPFGANIRGGHDMRREYRILRGLQPSYGKVPRPLLFCDDLNVLDGPFYVMERVKGIILRNLAPQQLDLTPDLMRQICLSLIDTFVNLHAIDYQAAGLGDLGKPAGYTARQVNGWSRRYADARTDDVPAMEHAAAWLHAHLPPEGDATLIHNDFKYDNVVLDPHDVSRIIAVLDWEMATLGDPLTDLGTTLAYWMEADDPAPLRQFGLTSLPGNLDRAQWAARYAERSGRDMSNILFYFVYGLFKNAVIVQQIYARYRKGLTNDERFANLIHMVCAYGDMAARAIERGRIHHLFA
ncbi:MAG TPA: phosphotransferase family protein [Roseiflexaceae bacterium]|nr:phosphotransferase family protein [Roseiflexaceae bacterium]